MFDTICLLIGFIVLNAYMVIAGKSATNAFLIGTVGGTLGYMIGMILLTSSAQADFLPAE